WLGYPSLPYYFTFPDKFLFFDLTQLGAKVLADAKNKLEVFIYLNRTSMDLERALTAEAFALGCTPIVNLFRQHAEPIQLTRSISEYRVVADARRPGVTEVYSVDSVVATAPDGTEVFLSLVDLDFNPSVPADTVLSVETTCLNRDLPARLPYGGGHPHLQLVDPAQGV